VKHAFSGCLGTAKLDGVKPYKFTNYFENEVLRKRPYLKKEWCIAYKSSKTPSGANRKRKIVSGSGEQSLNLVVGF
jgi:hypothetical protein